MIKRKYVLKNLPKLNATDILVVKKALDQYYKENKESLKIIPPDNIVLEIGIGLIPLVCPGLNMTKFNIVDDIDRIRENIARRYGILLPSIRIIDNQLLDTYEYCIIIKGKEYGKYNIDNKFIAIDGNKAKNKIKGKKIKEPVFNMPAVLIINKQLEKAFDEGYTIADSQTLILTHLSNILETNLDKIFSYDNSKHLLDEIQKKNPCLIDDITKNIKFINLKYILEKLISRQVSLINIEKILELVLININENKDVIVENIEKEMKLSHPVTL